METKELVKALLCCTGSPRIKDCKERCRYFRGGNMNKCIPDMGKDVASALESMQEELDRVKAERDAAVEDLKKAIFDDCTNSCTFCAHQNPKLEAPYCLAYFCENDEWQWRGLEGRTSHE